MDHALELARRTAVAVGSSYPLVDTEDLLQEASLWVLSHRTKVAEWSELEHFEAALVTAVRRALVRYAKRETRKRDSL